MNAEHIAKMREITIQKPQGKPIPGAAKTFEMITKDGQRFSALPCVGIRRNAEDLRIEPQRPLAALVDCRTGK
jgi:hypothetical protein